MMVMMDYFPAGSGSNPIDVTDPKWEIYVLVQKGQQDSCMRLLGFAAVYRFHRYPDSMRLRLGQVCSYLLVLKPRSIYASLLRRSKKQTKFIFFDHIKICCVDGRC